MALKPNNNSVVIKESKVVLQTELNYSISGLAKKLNEVFGEMRKNEGRSTKITTGVVHQYVLSGRLPAKYGGQYITQFYHEEMGLHFLKINEPIKKLD